MDTNEIKIRPATEADAAEILKYLCTLYNGHSNYI